MYKQRFSHATLVITEIKSKENGARRRNKSHCRDIFLNLAPAWILGCKPISSLEPKIFSEFHFMVVVISALCSDQYPRSVISAYRPQPGSSSWVELGQPEPASTLEYCTMDSVVWPVTT
jgi:hypothetical protein